MKVKEKTKGIMKFLCFYSVPSVISVAILFEGRLPLEGKQRVQLRRADEVVLGQSTDGMCRVINFALIVADGHVRMMIFAVRDPRCGVDKRNGLVIVLEFVGFGDHSILEFPTAQLTQEQADFLRLERRPTAFTRLAFF